MSDSPTPEEGALKTVSNDAPQAAGKESEPRKSDGGCLRAFVILALAVIVAGTGIAIYLGESVKQSWTSWTKGFFKSETTIKTEEVLLQMGRTHGDVLEVASPTIMSETFSKADARYAAWGWVYLGTAASEIKLPATYRFHIKLSEIKQARIDGGVLVVTAPVIHPSLPVAFDTAKVEKKADGTWLRYDAPQQLADLEKEVTPALAARAKAHVDTVREHARQDIEEFVQKWIVESHPEYREQIKAVKVIFPGEDARMKPAKPVVP